jgi:uncharacterized protein YjiS (DUF1127 family)
MTGQADAVRITTLREDTTMANTMTYDLNSSVLDGGAGFVARVRKAIADYRLYRATFDELAQLNDRELADLGLTRFMIRDVARGSVYPK